jgi:hypothetical protein
MAYQQPAPNHTHEAVSPLEEIQDDRYHQHHENQPSPSDINDTGDVPQYAYRVTLVDNKPQFTPASTVGPDDEFWTRKSGSTEVKVEQLPNLELPVSKKKKVDLSGFTWTWQVASLILSIASLAATIVVLVSIDRNPRLANWSVSSSSKLPTTLTSTISPNTLISVFAAISKAALLVAVADCIGQLKWIRFEQKPHLLKELDVYDEATRGPWGSLKLILMTKHTAILAGFGAFITIVSMAIDPFTQQILAHVTRTVVAQNETAAYNVAHMYDTGVQSSTLAAAGMVLPRLEKDLSS